jgi:hypothetical protein
MAYQINPRRHQSSVNTVAYNISNTAKKNLTLLVNLTPWWQMTIVPEWNAASVHEAEGNPEAVATSISRFTTLRED